MAVSEWELWAAAQQVMKQYGEHAAVHIAARVTRLALDGDMEGVSTWRRIAERIDRLSDDGGVWPKSQH